MSLIFFKSKSQTFRPKFSASNLRRGFTLLEMMVVISIFIITTGIVLANFKGFNRKTSLDLLAREISLVIRQAQVYGTATKFAPYGRGSSSDKGAFSSYGIYVNAYTPSSFILFTDSYDGNNKGKNKFHDDGDTCVKPNPSGSKGECVEQFNLYGGVKISAVKVCPGDSNPAIDDSECKDASTVYGSGKGLNIIFNRPKPGAEFSCKAGGGDCPITSVSYAKIIIQDPAMTTDNTRSIIVWNTGHIYVSSELGN